MPQHLKRICSAVSELPPDPDFQVSQQSELQFPEDSGQLSQQSEASMSALDEQESQASFIGSEDATPNTSFTEHQFKKPRRDRQKWLWKGSCASQLAKKTFEGYGKSKTEMICKLNGHFLKNCHFCERRWWFDETTNTTTDQWCGCGSFYRLGRGWRRWLWFWELFEGFIFVKWPNPCVFERLFDVFGRKTEFPRVSEQWPEHSFHHYDPP